MAAETNLGASILGKFFCSSPSALQNSEWNFCRFFLIIPFITSSDPMSVNSLSQLVNILWEISIFLLGGTQIMSTKWFSQVHTLVRGDPPTDVRCPLGQYDGVVQRPPRRSPSHGQTAEVGANVANNEVADSYLQRVNSGIFPVVVERDS